MSQLDALLTRSKQPGQFVERKAFSLARDKAVEKMREFSLRHPEQYILELIQAAVFADATWVAIDVTDNSILLGYIGGKRLLDKELDQLFDYLFVDQTHRPTRHLMQLAVGLNALIQRKPSVVRVESGTGRKGETSRLDLDANGKGTVGVADAPLAGTYIYAEFKSSWLGRFLSSNDVGFESDLVERRCIYTPVPILLNGRAPFGYTGRRNISLFGMSKQVDLAGVDAVGTRRGTIGVIKQSSLKSEFRMVVGGVLIGSLAIPELGEGLAGVLCDDSLRKTADMSDIVQEDRFVEMLHVLQPVANGLLKQRGKPYTPPQLPPRPKIRQSSEAETPRVDLPTITAEPLPTTIPQLGIRQPIPMHSIPKEDEGGFIFWVNPEDDLNEIERAADPLVLPYHILCLSPGQALTLERHTKFKTPRRLTSSEDIAFVRRAVERNQRIVEIAVPSASLPAHVNACRLRFHLKGDVPAWGYGSGVPSYIQDERGTRRLVRVPLLFPYVSMVVDLPELSKDTSLGELGILAEELLRNEVWRVLPEQSCDRSTELAAALIAVHCIPYFVQEASGAALQVGFPSRWWTEHITRILNMSLRVMEHPELTLQTLIDLQGTEQFIEMSAASAHALRSLEEQLGWGHIHTPELENECIAAWCRRGNRWHREVHLASALGHTACILLHPTLKPMVSSYSVTLPWNIPGISFINSGDEGDAPLSEEDWRAGLFYVLHDLTEAELTPVKQGSKQGWGLYERAFSDIQRSQAMGGLALIGIALALQAWDVPVILTTNGVAVSLSEIRDHRVGVAPRHGAFVQDDNVALLTYDEWVLLHQAGVSPKLYLDDSPMVWRELKESSKTWLLHQTLRIAGLEGKIGFRFPYDATSGILLESSRSVNVLTKYLACVPCHGLIELTGGLSKPTEMQGQMIALATNQLVQALLELLLTSSDVSRREAAEQYAAQYIFDLYRAHDGALPTRVARQMADIVTVPNDVGERVPILSMLDPVMDGRASRPSKDASSVPPIDNGVVFRRLRAAMQRLEKRVDLPHGSIRIARSAEESRTMFQSFKQGKTSPRSTSTLCRLIWGGSIEYDAHHRIAIAAEHNVYAMNLLIVEATRLIAYRLYETKQTTIEPNILIKQALMDRVMPTD